MPVGRWRCGWCVDEIELRAVYGVDEGFAADNGVRTFVSGRPARGLCPF